MLIFASCDRYIRTPVFSTTDRRSYKFSKIHIRGNALKVTTGVLVKVFGLFLRKSGMSKAQSRCSVVRVFLYLSPATIERSDVREECAGAQCDYGSEFLQMFQVMHIDKNV